MDTALFLKGAVIGFSIAMAVGPIALLCIRNSLCKGFWQGFATGLGAAVADGVYGAVAGFGITTITTLLLSYKSLLQIVGGLFLCYLALTMFRVKEVKERNGMTTMRFWPIFSATFFLTMTNPMTIVSFIAIYAALGVGGTNDAQGSAYLLTGGVFLGSALWYTLLSSITSCFKNTLTTTGSLWLNRASGCIILGFGIASLATA
jgi:threonine/homoserine/homoserine lactone efflux protein